MNYQSTTVHKSETPGFEGVSFTLREVSEAIRTNINIELAKPRRRIRELMADVEELVPEAGQVDETTSPDQLASLGKLAPKDQARLMNILDEIQMLRDSEINPFWVKRIVQKIDGLEIDGEPATAESLVSSGPRLLFSEVLALCQSKAGLTAQERKNFELPITSSAPEDGQTTPTSADPAKSGDGTEPATASATSPTS